MWNAQINFVLLTHMSMDELEQWAEDLRDEAKEHLLQGEQIEIGNVTELDRSNEERKAWSTKSEPE